MWILGLFSSGINKKDINSDSIYCRQCFAEGRLVEVNPENPVCPKKSEHNVTDYYDTAGEIREEVRELSKENRIKGEEILMRLDSNSGLN